MLGSLSGTLSCVGDAFGENLYVLLFSKCSGVRPIYCCLSLIYWEYIMATGKKQESDKERFRLCASPCQRFIMGGDTHNLCVACMGAEHARSALEGADCPHCLRLSMLTLRSWRALFEEGALSSAPRGSGPALAEAERRLKSWVSQMDLTERWKTGRSFSPSSPARSIAQSLGSEARSEMVSSAREWARRSFYLPLRREKVWASSEMRLWICHHSQFRSRSCWRCYQSCSKIKILSGQQIKSVRSVRKAS